MDSDLFGSDKAEIAMELIRTMEPSDGYYVAFSGGKDSIVTLDLVRRSGVKHDAHYNLTTVDPPEVVHFIKREYPDVAWSRPALTMWQLIVKKRMPPTRRYRYCCEHLKEGNGIGRVVITGVRAAESSRRAKRRQVEACTMSSKTYVHPIFGWSEDEVWQYIRERGLAYPSLYDEGRKRLGCVMCPMGNEKQMRADMVRWPKIARAYERAITKAWHKAKADGLNREGTTPESTFEWWITGGASTKAGSDGGLFCHDSDDEGA